TLFARRVEFINRQTRYALKRSDALHADCQRDIELAPHWGFDAHKPTLVVPGAGGIQSDLFKPGPVSSEVYANLNIPQGHPVVINPRGARAYVNNEVFFRSIPLVLQARPETIFVCVNLQGHTLAEKWVDELKINSNVRLTGPLDRREMA